MITIGTTDVISTRFVRDEGGIVLLSGLTDDNREACSPASGPSPR